MLEVTPTTLPREFRLHHPLLQRGSTMTDNTDLNTRLHEARYLAKLGFLYQRKRERFFDLADKITKALTVLLGASLLAAFIKEYVPIIGAIVSSIGLLSLVFGYTDKKQKHKELADSYAELQSRIESTCHRCNIEMVASWLQELQKLNSKEPPTLGTLVVICQNEIAIAEGHLGSVVPVSWYKQFFANWRDFPIAT